jgi:hypothetical protein
MSKSPRWTHARSGHSARRRAHRRVLSANRTLTRRARPPTGANQVQTAALQLRRLSNGEATALKLGSLAEKIGKLLAALYHNCRLAAH